MREASGDSGSLVRRYYYEGGINKLAMVEDSANTYVPLIDDRGTLMGAANTSGTVIEKLYYNATGLCKSYDGSDAENLRDGGSGPNIGKSEYIPFGWLGMYHDPFTGKYHTHYREYDPVHERWLNEDPAGYNDGLNLYAAYMGVNGVDPLGLGLYEDTFNLVDRYRFERGYIGGRFGISRELAHRMSRYYSQYLKAESARPSDLAVAGGAALDFTIGFGESVGHSAKGTWNCFGDAVTFGFTDYYGIDAGAYRQDLRNDSGFGSQAGLGFLRVGEKASQAALIVWGFDKALAATGIGAKVATVAAAHPTAAYNIAATGAGISAASVGWNTGSAINDAVGVIKGARNLFRPHCPYRTLLSGCYDASHASNGPDRWRYTSGQEPFY